MQRFFEGRGWSKEKPEERAGAPADAPAGPLSELSDFDGLLGLLDQCSRDVQEALRRLQGATRPLAERLQRFQREVPASRELLAQLEQQLGACAQQLGGGEEALQAVARLSKEALGQSSEVHGLFEVRGKALAKRDHCSQEVEAIHKRFGPSFSLEAKQARLRAKHEAEEEFRTRDGEASRRLAALLERRWAHLQPILSQLCLGHASIFADAQALATGLQGLAAQLTTPSDAAAAEAPPPEPPVRSEAGGAPVAPASDVPAGGSPREAEAGPAAPCGGPAEAEGALPSPAAAGGPPAAAAAAPGAPSLRAGDRVEVWSTGQEAWLEGLVEQVFDVPGVEDGFHVPAGVVKVSIATGVKFVRPEQIATTLRRLDSAERTG